MRWLTDLCYLLALLVTSPFWVSKVLRRNRHEADWPGRLGRTPMLQQCRLKRILLHAVSVGEVNALRQLVSGLTSDGRVEVVIATTTDTGFMRAMALFGEEHAVVRYPLDLSWSVQRFLRSIQPDLVGLVELEVWPNFVSACHRRSIPVAVINGRLSERSFRRYRRVRWVLRRTFSRLSWVGVQDSAYASRFEAMGVEASRIRVVGSLKWDNTGTQASEALVESARALSESMGIDRNRLLVVAGSTAPDEHALLHAAVPQGVQLLCAPRRPEWFDGAAETLAGATRRSSGLTGSNPDRYLLDTIGELSAAYQLADIVVIGRSFGMLHGSDVAEPAGLSKPILIGPAVADFAQMVETLKAGGGLIQCTRESLSSQLGALLDDADRRGALGALNLKTIQRMQGASQRTAETLLDL
jgi:3-deoxy-D-manno-octulosonic-acid transferase